MRVAKKEHRDAAGGKIHEQSSSEEPHKNRHRTCAIYTCPEIDLIPVDSQYAVRLSATRSDECALPEGTSMQTISKPFPCARTVGRGKRSRAQILRHARRVDVNCNVKEKATQA